MIPSTRTQFGEYILRALGDGAIEINITQNQLEDRIDEAILYWQMRHHDAYERSMYKYKVTQTDIDRGWCEFPDEVISVVEVFAAGSENSSSSFMSNLWQFKKGLAVDIAFTSGGGSSYTFSADYVAPMDYLNMIRSSLEKISIYEFNQHTNKLHVFSDWSTKYKADDWLVVDCYIATDPAIYTDAWSDSWLLQYAEALVGRQWGRNLQKYESIKLPGGITMNGGELRDQYDAEVKELRENFSRLCEEPVDFAIG